MAKSKAEKIQSLNPNYFVLGVDTVVACGRRILLKAENVEQAEKCIRLLSGRRHRVYTSVCLLTPDQSKQHIRTVVTIVKFKRLSEQEIKYYLASEEWKNRAGMQYTRPSWSVRIVLTRLLLFRYRVTIT